MKKTCLKPELGQRSRRHTCTIYCMINRALSVPSVKNDLRFILVGIVHLLNGFFWKILIKNNFIKMVNRGNFIFEQKFRQMYHI